MSYEDDKPHIPVYKITTIDNPYHPVNERDLWEQYDMEKGYNTDAILYATSGFSDDWTEAEQQIAENRAIDEMIRHDLECKYRKVLIEE